jgi:hypothetical protein
LNCYALIAPIRGHLAHMHEVVLFGGDSQGRIGTEARESLAKARLQIRGEITDPEVFGWTIESIPSPRIIKVVCPWWIGETNRVRCPAHPPYPRSWWFDDLQSDSGHPPATYAFAATITS